MTTKKDKPSDVAAMRPIDVGRWQSSAARQEAEARRLAELAEYAAELAAAEAIEVEARARFAAMPDAEYAFHLHHEKLFEALRGEGGKERIDYLMANKPLTELAVRLRLIRPIPNDRLPEKIDLGKIAGEKSTAYSKAKAALDKKKTELTRARTLLDNALYLSYGSTQSRITAMRAAIDAFAEAVEASGIIEAEALVTTTQREYEAVKFQTGTGLDPVAMDALHKELCEADCPWNGKSILVNA